MIARAGAALLRAGTARVAGRGSAIRHVLVSFCHGSLPCYSCVFPVPARRIFFIGRKHDLRFWSVGLEAQS